MNSGFNYSQIESLANLGFEWDFPAVSIAAPAVVIGNLDFSFAFEGLEGTALWQAKSMQASLQQWWNEFRLAVHLSTFSVQQKGQMLVGALALAITLFYVGSSAQETVNPQSEIQKENIAIAANEPEVFTKDERSTQMCDQEQYAMPVFEEAAVPTIIYTAEAAPVEVIAPAFLPPIAEKQKTKIKTTAEFIAGIQEKALQEEKLYFLKFGADWCLPCKMMERGAFADVLVQEKIASTYLKVDLDVDKGMGRRLKKEFDVSVMPTIIMFSAEGEELARFEQTFTINEMRNMLEMYDVPLYKGIRYNEEVALAK